MTSRSVSIARVLTKAILNQRLAPGAKVSERELGEVCGVSRIVARQALIRMAEDGLMTTELNRGAFVAKPSLRETIQIYEAMTVVEQGVAANVANRVGTPAWANLRQIVDRQRQATQTHNHHLSEHLGAEFHSQLVSLCDNPVLEVIHAQLTRRVTLLRSLFRSDFDACTLVEEHDKILDLIEKRQIKRVQELIADHNRLVVRGYHIDEDSPPAPTMPLAEALEPFLGLLKGD